MLPAVAAARILLPMTAAAIYLIYRYIRPGGKTELGVPLSGDQNPVVPRHPNSPPSPPRPPPSDIDPAILDEIQKLDPAVLDEIRKLDPSVVDEFRKLDPAVLDGIRRFDPAVVDELRKLDPSIIDQISKLCLNEDTKKNKNENENENEWNENGGEVEEKPADGSGGRQEYPVRPGAGDCNHYLRTGTCKFRSNCKYNHPPRRKNNQHFRSGGKPGNSRSFNHNRWGPSVAPIEGLNFLGLPIRPGEKECSHYMRNGSCKYGTNCRFNHPDPTAAGESRPPSRYGSGGPASLQGASSSMASPLSTPRSLNDTPLYEPMMNPQSQGFPFQDTEWNGYQAPPYLPERSMSAPPPYAMNNSASETVWEQYPQQKQVEELPERPGQPVCIHLSRTGDCKYKSNCKYHHPKNQSAVPPSCPLSDKGLPLRPGLNICTEYSRYGLCKFGEACKFDHPSLSTFFL